jgi:hypothetical protein
MNLCNFIIGRFHDGGYNFNGTIDEVQIYNRSLSTSEVKQLYEGSKLGGNKLANTNLATGDTWKVGVMGYDYLSSGS